MSMEREEKVVVTTDDVLNMLDDLFEQRDGSWWDGFYADREKPVPFFTDAPDEALVSGIASGRLRGGRALDIGCGNGRNTRYLAEHGYDAVGIDISGASIRWAGEVCAECAVRPAFCCCSLQDYEGTPESFDLIVDSGCFHHIRPHRRQQYLERIRDLLREDGWYLMTCMDREAGAAISDYDACRDFSMHGGMGFSEEKLRRVLSPFFRIDRIEKMRESHDPGVFGKSFLWVAWAGKKGCGSAAYV